jgi:hypothetical protein
VATARRTPGRPAASRAAACPPASTRSARRLGHLLTPSLKHDYVTVDYRGALKSADHIINYNWCNYVLRSVLEVARKVQSGCHHGKGPITLPGCNLFLRDPSQCRKIKVAGIESGTSTQALSCSKQKEQSPRYDLRACMSNSSKLVPSKPNHTGHNAAIDAAAKVHKTAQKRIWGSAHVVCVVHTPPVPSGTVSVQYVWSVSTQGNNHQSMCQMTLTGEDVCTSSVSFFSLCRGY